MTSRVFSPLDCQHCHQLYNQYHKPRILPCCSKTVCHLCVQLIERAMKKNETKFKCIACDSITEMPSKGFYVNEDLDRLLLSSQHRDKEPISDEEKMEIKSEESKLDILAMELKHQLSEGEYYIGESCNEIKRKVQLAKEESVLKIEEESETNNESASVKEEKILKIEVRADEMINEIDAYKQNLMQKFLKIDKKSKEEIIKRVDDLIEQRKASLSSNSDGDDDIFKRKIEREKEAIKSTVFSNQIMKFELSSHFEEDELIGHFNYEKIVCNVIFELFSLLLKINLI